MISLAAAMILSTPGPALEFDKLQYQDVQFALPDGRPDTSRPFNSWVEVRLTRRLVNLYSNGVDSIQKHSFKIRSIGSISRGGTGTLPLGVPAFTLPDPTQAVLNINKPKASYVMRDAAVPPHFTHKLFSIDESRTRAESRFFKGHEYLRYETVNSVIRYEETLTKD